MHKIRYGRPRNTIAVIAVAAMMLAVAPLVRLEAQDSIQGKEKILVAVSILPLEYFARRVGGDRVETIVLVGPGQSPHSYEPSPRQMAALARASVWFTTGIEFEKALVPRVRALYPRLVIVDSAAAVPPRSLEEHGHEEAEGQAEAHDADEMEARDPHVWLGRKGALIQAAAIRDSLSALDARGAATYAARYEAFAREVEAVFAELARDLSGLRGKPVFVYHPAFGYFLDEFGAVQVAVETGGKEPTQKGLAALTALARQKKATTIFVQPQFPQSAAASVARAIGGSVVQIDDLAADWLANLRRMGAALVAGSRQR